MAQRLATEYVKTTLTLSETQMDEFLQAVNDPQVHYRIKVLDNGRQEIVLEHIAGEEVHLFFEAKEGAFVCELTCRLVHPQLTLFIRQLFVRFKGEGIVYRMYQGFTMVYFYNEGAVRKIMEKDAEGSRLVFEYRNTVQELQQLFQHQNVEKEIADVYNLINSLLDERNLARTFSELEQIDHKLRMSCSKLFALEA
ncbi:non-ribosomal peptide synthetase module [Paenibacillus sp. EKM102P]|uniref:non-ribosomal peptide synthetase module n=1 Tax=unclassified Paenibacillus TaxID=185978 RepID=UPI00142E59BF|nr:MULTISPECIES: non-ribosomal peptide synthetase module [unclassified Paenibacillus]KAF6617883.1 non-ribosomal peptide synthetase module [Paenibacillus sp. EKM101P]KAF6618692.1 non-ribosomal peptide synthetase module [Paenibacillus sp. EKM102P]KAF6626822.1 non-ribosomal peptide synthetase module [Paenibacillus sp. EKM10P]KAF6646439.1 non-ribosomal peptide synthetase module [Paenibacillus sp. EKM11P]